MRRGDTRRPADLLACQAGQAHVRRAGSRRQHHHVLHRAGQADADDQPDQARQVAELDRQHGPDQRAGPRDRREVMAEEDPAVGGVEVLAVAEIGAPGVTRLSSSTATLAARNAL